MPERPPKHKTCKRYNIPGDAHELTFSCFEKQPLLLQDRARVCLAQSIAKARVKHGFHLWAWLFMPDHIHLLIFPTSEEYSISDILQSIKQPVAKKEIDFARKHDHERLMMMSSRDRNRPFKFWQEGGGYDRNMTPAKILRDAVEYIHNNPVRKGLVENAEDWKWSSYREWMNMGKGLLKVDRESFPMS